MTTQNRQDGLLLLLLGAAILVVVGSGLHLVLTNSMDDFRGVYNATQSMFEHRDPYRVNTLDDKHLEFGDKNFPGVGVPNRNVPLYVYLPPSTSIFLPFALLPWKVAEVLWTICFTVGMVLAAYLIWDVSALYAPRISGGLICILLANCIIVFANGNPAGLAVAFCAIGTWCILSERFVPVGVICLALSLIIKPHDSGLVWLCFFLAGGTYRKRSILTLASVVLLGIPTLFWMGLISPHWIVELRANLAALGGHGGLSDPGPAGPFSLSIQPIINLQAAVAYLRDDPGLYSPISYAICGALGLIWSIVTLRAPASRNQLWFAIAFASVLTMLVTYHRPYDAKLLLLTVPATAILWTEGGMTGWMALVISSLGMILTGEIPLAAMGAFVGKLGVGNGGFSERLLTVAIARPASLLLLVMGVFYLWVYLRRTREVKNIGSPRETFESC